MVSVMLRNAMGAYKRGALVVAQMSAYIRRVLIILILRYLCINYQAHAQHGPLHMRAPPPQRS